MDSSVLENTIDTIDSLVNEVNCNDDKLDLIFEILSSLQESSAGKQLLNLAINRQKLRYLQTEVLPRRKAGLIQFLDDKSMPKGIQNFFVDEQMLLIKKVAHEIFQLSIYDQNASRAFQKNEDTIIFAELVRVKNRQMA